MKTILILLTLTLAACSTPQPAPAPKPVPPVEVELTSDRFMNPMTRNEVIMAINECEANNTRAVVINSRRKINGYSTEVVVDVTCAPKYKF
ncbi:hypothetical protein UFOVP137_45 [uncultured Caudovirales phage]|uniref:Lipoprotein n=1 Tax=uncultured Caudovirales phage TaxID=2100421 RepID=A0A6J5LBS1_9CAUD|nr:hypothetical protein UFOVP137_45 [uncultured Caudovirales phage]